MPRPFTIVLSFSLFVSVTTLKAQEQLNFDKRLIHCIDQWVVFPMEKDSSSAFGFIYFDTQAGLTLNYEGKFTISPNGSYLPDKVENGMYKYRLNPTNTLVAILPDARLSELGISKYPDWLEIYNRDTTSALRLYKLGYAHNAWRECEKARELLEKAAKADPTLKGLKVELAFSNNCLKNYERAIAILEEAWADDPKDAYVNKELIYSYTLSGNHEKALEYCKRAIRDLAETRYHGENTYNLLYSYYLANDKEKFKNWVEETRKWNKDNAALMLNIGLMEKELL